MFVTVLICTRNQARSLERTLLSLARQKVADDVSWCVTVVNNGSSDDTSRRLKSFRKVLDLQEIYEPVPGLSRARNRGLENLTQGYVLCTDDDVSVPRYWITHYVNAFRRYPDVSFFGSEVIPQFVNGDPRWAQAAVVAAASCFAQLLVGEHDRPISSNKATRHLPFGANMAFKVEALKTFRFDETLGRQPNGVILSGEETKLIGEMIAAGHSGYLLAENPVTHHIAPTRQTLDYINRYYFGQGWLQASKVVNSKEWTIPADRIVSQAIAGTTRLARPLVSALPSRVLSVWLERQHGHFNGRTAAFRRSTHSD